jgi:hypothetical protein
MLPLRQQVLSLVLAMMEYVRDRCCWRIDSIDLKQLFYSRLPLYDKTLASRSDHVTQLLSH